MNFFRRQTTGPTGDLENCAGSMSDTPLPSYNDAIVSTQQNFLTAIAGRQQRRSAEEVSTLSPGASAEADRLQRFLRFNLALDYQDDCSVSVSAEDRAHFATMNNLLDDLASTNETVFPNSRERAAFAPYFWHMLHEPCIVLEVPVELVMDYVKRFFLYQGNRANYKGSISHIPLREGVDRLAQKLVTDREIMIPKCIQEPYMRMRFYERLEARMKLYFSSVRGAESYTSLSRRHLRPNPTSAQWWADTAVSYQLNENGKNWSDKRRYCVQTGQGMTFAHIATWVQRAKTTIDLMIRRADQPGAKEVVFFAPPPPGGQWVHRRTYYLPDVFARLHRPSETYG